MRYVVHPTRRAPSSRARARRRCRLSSSWLPNSVMRPSSTTTRSASCAAELATLTGHVAPVEAFAAAPDGHTAGSGGEDWMALLWTIGPVAVASEIYTLASAPISGSDWARCLPGHDYQPPC